MDFPICTTPIPQLVKNEDVKVIHTKYSVWGWWVKNGTIIQHMIVGFTEDPTQCVKIIEVM